MKFFRSLKSKKARQGSLDSLRKLVSSYKQQKLMAKVNLKMKQQQIGHFVDNSIYKGSKDFIDEDRFDIF